MINQKKPQNFEAFGIIILNSLHILKYSYPLYLKQIQLNQRYVREESLFLLKNNKLISAHNQQNIRHNHQEQLKKIKLQKRRNPSVTVVLYTEQMILLNSLLQKPKQSKIKKIKKPQPQLKQQVEEPIQINQEVTNIEVDKPLTYIIIRTVKIKEVKGEIIVNYKDKSECLQIRNRLLNFDDVKQKFPYIDNLNEKILVEVDNDIIIKKNMIGWMDCRDCEEYRLQ